MTMLKAIHRIQTRLDGKRVAIPPNAVFELDDDKDADLIESLTSGEDPAAVEAKKSDELLAEENGIKVQVRPRRVMTRREVQARQLAEMQGSILPAKAANAPQENGDGEETTEEGKGTKKGGKKNRDNLV